MQAGNWASTVSPVSHYYWLNIGDYWIQFAYPVSTTRGKKENTSWLCTPYHLLLLCSSSLGLLSLGTCITHNNIITLQPYRGGKSSDWMGNRTSEILLPWLHKFNYQMNLDKHNNLSLSDPWVMDVTSICDAVSPLLTHLNPLCIPSDWISSWGRSFYGPPKEINKWERHCSCTYPTMCGLDNM